MYELFPEYVKGDDITLANANNLNKVARHYAATHPGANLFGFGHQIAGPAAFVQRNVIVTEKRTTESDADQQSDESNSVSSHSSSSSIVSGTAEEWPCDGADYRVRHQYYDQDTSTFVTDTADNEYCLDATGFGSFEVGDKLVAWWDAQRGMYRPTTNKPTSTRFAFIRARLQETMEPLGDANAAISGWDGTNWTDTTEIAYVVDGMPGALDVTLPVGTIIYASWFEPRQAYLLTNVPCELPE